MRYRRLIILITKKQFEYYLGYLILSDRNLWRISGVKFRHLLLKGYPVVYKKEYTKKYGFVINLTEAEFNIKVWFKYLYTVKSEDYTIGQGTTDVIPCNDVSKWMKRK